MLKTQDKLFLAGAAVCGIVAAVSGALYLKAKTPEPIPTIRVLVAARDIPANRKLTEKDLEVREIPLIDEKLQSATIPAENRDLIANRAVSQPVTKGVFLTESLFTQLNVFTVSEGKFGMAISPRSAAMLAADQLVDVYVCPPRPKVEDSVGAAASKPGAGGNPLAMFDLAGDDRPVDAKLVLEGVRVLSVGDRIRDLQVTMHDELDDEGGRRQDVMLELSREEVARLLSESRDFGLPMTLVIRGGVTPSRLSAR